MPLHEIQREAVIAAIGAFDALGREEFLRKYGFGRSKSYFLVHNGREYDSKAILGVAYGFQFPEVGQLSAGDFSGGESTVQAQLERLGFQVEVKQGGVQETTTVFTKGQEYRRRDIHHWYGGQQQNGISSPSRYPYIFLFSSEHGEEYGYSDGWSSSEEGIYLYTGEGVEGDMVFERGNRAIRDHLTDSKDIYLFKASRSGHVIFVDQMVCVGFHYRRANDFYGNDRQAIVFQLRPVEGVKEQPSVDEDIPEIAEEFKQRSIHDLRKIAIESATLAQTPVERITLYRYRSRAIKVYALERAAGQCAGCNQSAPFETPNGIPFLEVHHLNRLADDGPDHPEAVIAVCPNCHRRAHHSHDAIEFNKHLRDAAKRQEATVQ